MTVGQKRQERALLVWVTIAIVLAGIAGWVSAPFGVVPR